MKTFLTLLLTLFFVGGTINAQVFVNHAAVGANDGTSWSDAYVYLDDALASSSPMDQIWVAAGTYNPGGTTPSVDTFFTFPHDLELYGGFAGTETVLSERDWVVNETILSGDHNGDDMEDDFDENRTDNSLHVMWLTDTVTVASTIDGFTIRNGNTEPSSGAGDARRGGGILTYGAPAIRNCTFTQNFGHFGGGLYPRGAGATGVVIEDCVFESNQGGFGGGIYLNGDSGTMSNCSFINNVVATRGGGFYNNAELGVVVSDCVFTGNESESSRGGGVYNTASPSSYTNCMFTDNSASMSSGGGLQVRNTNDDLIHITVNVTDCTFEGNEATFGGGVGSYDQLSTTVLTNCTFTNNNGINVGGGLSNAFGAETIITDCMFTENTSSNGGALYSQNDSARVTITNTVMTMNTADERGGAINISGDNEPGTTLPIPMLTIENTSIFLNSCIEQGAGLNISNANMDLVNTLLHLNAVIDVEGIGGAMSLNTSDSIQASFSILNSTIVDNSAFIGAGIANWRQENSLGGSSELTLQNTVFANINGANYEIEAGEPVVSSNGGNLSQDFSLETILVNTNDLNGLDPLFVDYSGGDFHLQNDSPCVDAGVTTGAPLMDIEGNDRVDEVDMGAYENQKLVSVQELNKYFGKLNIYPNPVDDVLNFAFESAWNGRLNISVIGVDGKVILSQQFEKSNDILSASFNVEILPVGIYTLSVSNGVLTNTQGFVK